MDSKESFSAEEVNMFADYTEISIINRLLAIYCNCTLEHCAHKFHSRLNNHAVRPRILRVIYPSSYCRDYVLAAGPVAVRAAARTGMGEGDAMKDYGKKLLNTWKIGFSLPNQYLSEHDRILIH
ncbi:hypothetical protein DdX_12228 [Ditylenchus destructor]|uniref:Uncharacterized protein n=1 Tax=Ditylenchus destructor TaxID=166010 RepID=A0AAD4MYG5_9BILA|nr:hypothetical protein DdX_12228 [Ditylenchus destructor]